MKRAQAFCVEIKKMFFTHLRINNIINELMMLLELI